MRSGVVGRLIFETRYESPEVPAEPSISSAVANELLLEEFEAGFKELFRREAVKVVLYP